MNVALLTIWHEMNYGAELQAYATIKILKNLGHNVRMIDIRLSDRDCLSLKSRIIQLIKSYSPVSRKFNAFWKDHIPTTKRYYSIEQLCKDWPNADVYVVGSDQVWNPQITGTFNDIFFLNFGSSDVKRISLASSFGQDAWEYPELIPSIKRLLSKFSLISCREESGVKILKETFGYDAKLVLDPTLLLDSYSELYDGNFNTTDKIVYYPLSDDRELADLANKLADYYNIEAVNINKASYLWGKILWDKPSIGEWLKNIAEAKFVITRSFHGLVFSLLFNKDFAVLKGRNNRTTRLTNLLKLLNLEDRMFNDTKEMWQKAPWNAPICYKQVNRRLSELRECSLKTIKEAL